MQLCAGKHENLEETGMFSGKEKLILGWKEEAKLRWLQKERAGDRRGDEARPQWTPTSGTKSAVRAAERGRPLPATALLCLHGKGPQ